MDSSSDKPRLAESAAKANQSPYARFANVDMILRDQLALDRTVLANERTLLSYLRTLLALVLAGATVIRLLEDAPSLAFGWGLIVLGGVAGGIGIRRYVRMARSISSGLSDPPDHLQNL